MPRRLSRISLALIFLLSSEAWALGLGEITLESALNEPLRAEIALLSATPDELAGLRITLASAETFDRYGLDRPVYLQAIEFQIVRSGDAVGNVIEIRSAAPTTEPFLTFLVEASWSRGRLLREYTLLLDPPTFAPAALAQPTPAVAAPTRSDPVDSGRIERPAPASQRQPPAPTRTSPPSASRLPRDSSPPPVVDDLPYDSSAGDHYVQRNETLWGITSRVRPDSRLTMNQTMLAIFEANPDAFGGNINILRAGAYLRIPGADEIYEIGRGEALDEVQRQHAAWDTGYTPAPTPIIDDTPSQPSLTLVPPDDDYLDDTDSLYTGYDDEPITREQEILQRIEDLDAADIPQQQSLLEIRDNEMAALQQELARIRGEAYEPPVDDAIDDDLYVDDSDIVAGDQDDLGSDAVVADDATPEPALTAEPTSRSEPGLLDRILDALTSWWMYIAGTVVAVAGLLFWFMRRGDDEEEEPEAWRALDADDAGAEDTIEATGRMPAPIHDDSIVVVEQESAINDPDLTVDAPAPDFVPEPTPEPVPEEPPERREETGQFDSLEDTFSSETAINLDQSDPIAEADFHMAYGLYDQAADLVTGALQAEPDRQDLLSKLCEIYFVWGNRDAFVDAAGKLKVVVGDVQSAEWDKIVIMGQQIAADDELFAGAAIGAATKVVDLSFEADMQETGELDMELIAEPGAADDVVDLGGEATEVIEDKDRLDFAFDEAPAEVSAVDLDVTAESPAVEEPDFDLTAELPVAEAADDSPTIEQQMDELIGTGEVPSIDDTLGAAIETSGQSSDATAEIDLADLGLDLDGLDATELAPLDDQDATEMAPLDDLAETEMAPLDDQDATEMAPPDDLDATASNEAPLDDLDATASNEAPLVDLEVTAEASAMEQTGINEELDDLNEVTGRNPEIDPSATGVQTALAADQTGINEILPDQSLLDATGVTQVLPDDLIVETLTGLEAALDDNDATLLAPDLRDDGTFEGSSDEDATMLASLDDDDDSTDFDFARTEALPPDTFTDSSTLDETGELPAVASTDVDLDLDDLTAALQVSEMGDTIQQMRDDATIEQPRPDMSTMPDDDVSPTMNLEPGELSDDLNDALTMTEVGTKLDLARAYVDMGDPGGARSILEEVLNEGDDAQRQQAQQLLDSLSS